MGVLDEAILGRPLGGLASVPGCVGVTNVTDPATPGETATAVFALESHSSATEVAVTAAVFVAGVDIGAERSFTLQPGELRGDNRIDFTVPTARRFEGTVEVAVRVVDATEVPGGL